MFDFPTNGKKQAAGKGKQFMSEAKEQHDELVSAFAENAGEYSSVEEYTDALEEQSWQLLEAVCKSSYKNGIARGQRGGQRSRG